MKNSIKAFALLALLGWAACHAPQSEPAQAPNGRAEWRSMMRNHDASPEKVLAAREEVRKDFQSLPQGNARDAGLNKWDELAAGNGAGRVRTIAVHPTDPDILYVGAASGGIWKSTDAGSSWTVLDDFLASLSVTSIIVHPTHPDTLYAATGESIVFDTEAQSSPGAGIFRSINGGSSWKLVTAIDPTDLTNFYWVNKITFDPSNPSSFYATSNGNSAANGWNSNKLFRFDNNGSTKAELPLFGAVSSANSVTNVVVNPGDPNHILVCTSSGLLQSYDKGSTWTVASTANTPGWISPSNRVEVGISAANPNLVYALCQGSTTAAPNGANLLYSTNKGANWTVAQTNSSILAGNGWYHNVIWVDPLNANFLIVGGIDLWKSTNSGLTLSPITDWTKNDLGTSPHADHHVIVAASDFSSINPRLYFGNDGGIASTANWTTVTETTGWELLNNNQLGITQYYESDIFDTTIIGGSQDNGSWLSKDDGDMFDWKFSGGDGGGCAVSRQDQNLIFTSVQFGQVKATSYQLLTFGGTFAGVNLIDVTDYEPLDSAPFLMQMEAFPNAGHKVLVGSYSLWEVEVDPANYLLVNTTNRSPQAGSLTAPITAIDISSGGDTVVIGYASGEVWLGTVLSPSWVWSKINDLNRVITAVDIAGYNKKKIAVATGGYVEDNIWVTTDAGVTWNEKSNGIPALQVNTVRWHPDATNFIYAGTDLGIFSSDDSGSNWNVTPNYGGISDGPAFTEISELQFSKGVTSANFHYLYATTFGRGIWRTENIVRKNTYINHDYTNSPQLGTQSRPFQFVDQAENVKAHGQTWYFDATTNTNKTNYEVPTGGVLIDKRIGVIKRFPGKTGPVVIGN